MKHNTQSMCILTIIILTLACFAEHAAAFGADPGTTFTYQGRLLTGGAPLDGTADLEFRIFSSAGAGVQIGNTLVFNDHPIVDGFFTAQLNFSAAELLFRADARWLEIVVNGTTLSPRQRIRPTPVALSLPGLWTEQNGSAEVVNVIGGYHNNSTGPGVVGAAIGGGGSGATLNAVYDSYGVVGGGDNNTAGSNDASDNARYATVAGGQGNIALRFASVGGGLDNNAAGEYAAIGGGQNNAAGGHASAVGGGLNNFASGSFAVIPGGSQNIAAGSHSFAAGLQANALHPGSFVWADGAGGVFASSLPDQFLIRADGGVGINTNVPNVPLHVAGGSGMTLATGGYAQFGPTNGGNLAFDDNEIMARNNGAGNNLFLNRQGGNVAIATGNPIFTLTVSGTAGKPGGGSWSNFSDRRLKRDITPIAGALDALLALTGVTFEYIDPESINELPGPRIGMIAQDVEAVFPDWVDELGDGYKTVTYRGFEALTVEALRELRAEKDAEIDALRDENTELRTRLEALERMIQELAADREGAHR